MNLIGIIGLIFSVRTTSAFNYPVHGSSASAVKVSLSSPSPRTFPSPRRRLSFIILKAEDVGSDAEERTVEDASALSAPETEAKDEASAPETEAEDEALLQKRKQVLISARDPFVGVRLAAWSILGLASTIGAGSAIVSGDLGNAAINGGVAVFMVAALLVEKKIGDEGKKKIEEELASQMLKGGMESFVKKREEV